MNRFGKAVLSRGLTEVGSIHFVRAIPVIPCFQPVIVYDSGLADKPLPMESGGPPPHVHGIFRRPDAAEARRSPRPRSIVPETFTFSTLERQR